MSKIKGFLPHFLAGCSAAALVAVQPGAFDAAKIGSIVAAFLGAAGLLAAKVGK